MSTNIGTLRVLNFGRRSWDSAPEVRCRHLDPRTRYRALPTRGCCFEGDRKRVGFTRLYIGPCSYANDALVALSVGNHLSSHSCIHPWRPTHPNTSIADYLRIAAASDYSISVFSSSVQAFRRGKATKRYPSGPGFLCRSKFISGILSRP